MKFPVYKAVINDDDFGMDCLSLVTTPAVEQDFLCFDKVETVRFDKEKQYITGVVMLADTPIYRRSESMGEYYIMFEKDTIKKMVEKYIQSGMFSNISCQHDGNLIDGFSLVETYFVDDTKPSPFKIPEGSVVMTFKCNNAEVWSRIESGELKGFSLEALIGLEPEEFQKKDMSFDEWLDEYLK